MDHYFVIMEKLGERFEDLEDAVVSNPEPGILPTIYNLKRDMLFLRKSVWPLREAISKMQRTDSPLVSEIHQDLSARCLRPYHPGDREH